MVPGLMTRFRHRDGRDGDRQRDRGKGERWREKEIERERGSYHFCHKWKSPTVSKQE